MDSEESVGCEFLQKRAEGTKVPEATPGSQANERVVSHRLQEINVLRIDRDAAELETLISIRAMRLMGSLAP